MTLRTMFVLLIAVLFLPFAVFLRSSYAGESPDPCTVIAKAQRTIALARDK